MTDADTGDELAGVARVLEDSRRHGFVGPGPVEVHLQHARGFAMVIGRAPDAFLDLGAGGGVPGLVLAMLWPRSTAVLLDASSRRTAFLQDAVAQLGLGDRATVVCARAEEAARDHRWRATFAVVTARSFGSPPVTAECATGFLAPDGRLVVSEPPDDESGRWPDDAVAQLGLVVERGPESDSRFVVLRRQGDVGERWPRRTGVPSKRPLWR